MVGPSHGMLSMFNQSQILKRNRENSLEKVHVQNSVQHARCSEYVDDDYVDETMIAKESDLQIKTEEEANTSEIFGVETTSNAYLINDQMSGNQFYPRSATFVCDVCGQAFSERSNLSAHKQNIHAGENSYICDVCQIGFSLKTDLDRHIQVHSGEKEYICNVCGIGFNDSGVFNSHKQSLHIGEESNICGTCGIEFSVIHELDEHKQIHSGERNYQCNILGKGLPRSHVENTFISPESISHVKMEKEADPSDITGNEFSDNASQKRQQSDAKEKPYICDTCGEGFTGSKKLTTHKRIHTGDKHFICDTCGKGYSQRRNLDIHKRVHTGEEPYSCDVCDKGFRRISLLNRHKRIHTGERAYKCDLCGKVFKHTNSLNPHKCIHTRKKPHICDTCGKEFSRSSDVTRHNAFILERGISFVIYVERHLVIVTFSLYISEFIPKRNLTFVIYVDKDLVKLAI